MCSTRRVLHEIAQASQAVVQFFGRHMFFRRTPTMLFVGFGLVVGIVRFLLQKQGKEEGRFTRKSRRERERLSTAS